MRHPPAPLATGLVVAASLPALTACAPVVPVEAAPSATDPVCASVVLTLPDTLGEGLDRLDTDAQATTAWGEPRHPVVLRCGVEPLGPTPEQCRSVTTPGGPTVDWVVVEDDRGWTFTTYGRVPAVEVVVPQVVASSRSTAFVDLLGPAVDLTERERGCL